jgi:hypothetical protein
VSEEAKPAEPPRKQTQPRAWRKVLSIPGFIGTTAAAALISWGINFAATSATATTGPPVTVTVLSDPGKLPYFGGVGGAVLPSARSDAGNPGGGCTGFFRWAEHNGGVPSGAEFQVVVQSATTQAVVLTAMRVKVVGRLPALTGPDVVCPSAGTIDFRPIFIDLDSTPPAVTYKYKGQATPFGFTLSGGESEVFEVTAMTQRAHYLFDLELDLIVGGQPQTITITDGGRPFQATSSADNGIVWEWNYQNAWEGFTVPANKSVGTVPVGHPFPPRS